VFIAFETNAHSVGVLIAQHCLAHNLDRWKSLAQEIIVKLLQRKTPRPASSSCLRAAS